MHTQQSPHTDGLPGDPSQASGDPSRAWAQNIHKTLPGPHGEEPEGTLPWALAVGSLFRTSEHISTTLHTCQVRLSVDALHGVCVCVCVCARARRSRPPHGRGMFSWREGWARGVFIKGQRTFPGCMWHAHTVV